MSLIMDALKKAQQLRWEGSEGAPILKYPHQNKKRGKGSKNRGVLIGMGLINLCLILFFLIKPASPPLATQSYQPIVPTDRKPFDPVTEKIFTEPPREVSIPTRDVELLPTGQAEAKELPHIKMALNSPHSLTQGGKVTSCTKLSPNNERGEKPIEQAPERERLKHPKEVVMKKSLPVVPLSTQKEELPPKPIGVEQEGRKDRTLTLEVLNHFNSGVHFYEEREFSKAIQAYQKVTELDPTYVEAYNNLGIIYQMLGDMEKAFEFYQKSTEINPKYEKGYNNLGIILFLKGRYEEAREAFQKALAINSNNIESHINLGILFKKKGEREKAIESYRKALAINPFHNETHYNIALLYEQLENSEMAVSHFQQFILLSSKSHPDLVSKVQRHLNAIVEAKRNKM